MSYNGSGTFQINTSGQPVVTGTSISSTVFNALTADLATGLSTAITKDGQTTTTARIPFALGINSTLVTDATNTTSGSIITAGGVGIAKALYVGTTANVAGLTASSAVATDASKNLVSVTNTGTGNNVLATGPTISGPTISDGTANGVAYLNASKVLTTGSALVFDGTNFGVGVTPSAYDSSIKAIDIGLGTAILNPNSTGQTWFLTNAYYGSSAFRYKASGVEATRYDQASGTHKFYTAPTGTAGNAITFTQAMTLDASGYLSLGATTVSASHLLKVANTTNAGLIFTGANSVLNDGTLSATVVNGSMLMVAENNVGTGALFFCTYASATITLISDPSSGFAVSITAGRICCTKSANSSTVTITNKTGSTKSITFSKVSTSD